MGAVYRESASRVKKFKKKSVGEVFFEERRVAVNNCSELIRNIALIMMNRCK